MTNFTRHTVTRLILAILLAPAAVHVAAQQPDGVAMQYEDAVRSSEYVEMTDGTRIAVDVWRPTSNGAPYVDALPAVWVDTPYFRALMAPDGRVISSADSPVGRAFARNGYVLVIADIRGTGASFGQQTGIFTRQEGRDGYEITEWIAAQPWCDGNVGMMGGSYDGVAQLITAAEAPPHLRAIFPAMAPFDLYTMIYHGGILYDDFLAQGDAIQQERNDDLGQFAAPVDLDTARELVEEARSEHLSDRGRPALLATFAPLPFRDSIDPFTGDRPYYDWSPSGRITEIRESRIPVYVYAGWFDLFTRDAFLLYANLDQASRLTVVDTAHKGRSSEELLEFYIDEQLRWFDYWLKGVENGVMDEPPIQLQEIDGSSSHMAHLDQWPPPSAVDQVYYLRAPGTLSSRPPGPGEPPDDYQVREDTTSGSTSRWANANTNPFSYPDMAGNDEKALTYTTPILTEDVTVLGHPVVSLWCELNRADADVFVYLEDVAPDGTSRYVTEGALRASHRAGAESPYDSLGLPYRSHLSPDISTVPVGEPVRLALDLLPTFYTFGAGHRIRLAISGADRDNASIPEGAVGTMISVLHTPDLQSSFLLPRIENAHGTR